MFEVGLKYAIKFGGGEEYHVTYGTVLEYQHPLVKIKEDNGAEQVINVANPDFHSATVWSKRP